MNTHKPNSAFFLGMDVLTREGYIEWGKRFFVVVLRFFFVSLEMHDVCCPLYGLLRGVKRGYCEEF